VLELRNITAGYGSHLVLRDVSLIVPDNAVVALLGPNGAGKTTLLRVASGVVPPAAGSVIFDGEDVTGWSPERLAQAGICHVPEGRGVFPALTVADNLRLQAPPSKERTAVAAALSAFPRLQERQTQLAVRSDLERCYSLFPVLAERAEQRAGTLSGGEQQMLALARAYASEPTVALLDEVSMGLAPNIVDEIFRHLNALSKLGVALLVVEQYVTRALQLADLVYVLRQGRIAMAAEPDELGEEVILASYLGAP
jgi:branched-chain amino acid transport system ATP-binding protein